MTGSVRVFASRRSGSLAIEQRVATIAPDGAFEVGSLAPGEYVAQAFSNGEFGSPIRFGAAGDGSFTVGGLPPADYRVAAVDTSVDGANADDVQNPDVLEKLAAGARRVTLGEGEAVTLQPIRPSR